MSVVEPQEARIVELSRRLGAQSVLRSSEIARRAGFSPSDLECIDVLRYDGPCTAGTIMARTGLTSGAVTALIDRLEQRGLVTRGRDPIDRRRLRVAVDQDAIAPIASLYASGARRWTPLLAEFTDAELATIERFLERALATAVELTIELRDGDLPTA